MAEGEREEMAKGMNGWRKGAGSGQGGSRGKGVEEGGEGRGRERKREELYSSHKLVLHSCSYHSRYAIDNVPTIAVGAYKVYL